MSENTERIIWRILYVVGAIILALIVLDLIPIALSHRAEAAFVGQLRIGQTRNEVVNIVQKNHLKLATFHFQRADQLIVEISDRYRLGTPCNEILYERLTFDADGLVTWSPWPTQSCM